MGTKHPEPVQNEAEFDGEDFYLENWEIVNNSASIDSKKNKININKNILINQIKSDPYKDYSVIKELGSGTYAKVELVKHNINGAIRAMKVIRKKQKKKTNTTNEEDVINEVGILMRIDHPNIVKIFEFYNGENEYFLVMEYCGGGELFDMIVNKTLLTEIQTAYIMYQILSAINYCHKMKIIHRDLKPENILIKKDEDGFYKVKICDFGTSQVFKIGDIQNKLVGSAFYIAPEVIKKKYNYKCDLWSCGVIMYVLLTKKVPFGGKSDAQIINNVLIGKYTTERLQDYSPYALDLITKLLETDISKRINAETALNHKWFDIFKSKEILYDIHGKEKIGRFIENLKNYQCTSIIQETALAFLVHNYPDLDEIVDACKLFGKIDKTGCGRITVEDLYSGLSSLIKRNTLKDDVIKIFENLDSDKSNYLEYEEFVRAAINKSIFLTDQALKYSFSFFDKEKKGEITFDEISSIFKDCIDSKEDINEELKKIIKEVTVNSDEKIRYNEFCELMKKILK